MQICAQRKVNSARGQKITAVANSRLVFIEILTSRITRWNVYWVFCFGLVFVCFLGSGLVCYFLLNFWHDNNENAAGLEVVFVGELVLASRWGGGGDAGK